MLEQLFDRLQDIYPKLVEIRRDLHMYPELSFQEVRTPQKISTFLIDLGLEVRTGVGGRGVVGILRGGKKGKTVALRADFDALPIQDEKDVPYKSKVPGVMHACGHDIHTAALLGVAKVLSEVKEQIEGNIVFIHQFAEEQFPGGAKAMIEDGCLDGVDVIYGAHVFTFEPFGTVGVRPGIMMSAADSFEIEIIGKGGHASQPHNTMDPVLLGSQLVVNLQQIVSRRIDPLEPAVVSVCTFNSGEAYNVIPHTAKITGSVRSFSSEVRGLIEETIGQIAKSTCEAGGATINYTYKRGYPSVKNTPTETQRGEELAKLLVGSENIIHRKLGMGSEDFSYYLEKVPGSFFSVGGQNQEIDAIYTNHHPKFDVDERSMLIIGKLFISLVFNYLSNGMIKPLSIEKALNIEGITNNYTNSGY